MSLRRIKGTPGGELINRPTERAPAARHRSDAAPFIRHVALCVAALTAYLLRDQLRAGSGVLWIVGVAALLNVATSLLSERPGLGRLARLASSAFGIAGWASLVLMTGGARSPFTAGFGLEILLSALAFSPAGTLLVTAGAIAGLWGQQALLGLRHALSSVSLQTGILVAMGVLTLHVGCRSARAQARLSDRGAELRRKLLRLEKELEELRTLGRMGDNAGRLAHALANAVHTLRGFTQLIEPGLAGGARNRRALEGLRDSIDQLEQIARCTLRPPPASTCGQVEAGWAEIDRVIERVVAQVGRTHPSIHWTRNGTGGLPAVAVSPEVVEEILTVLARNAAEASSPGAEVIVAARAEDGQLRIRVRDHGCGLPAQGLERLFAAGYSTKPRGNGFGLYLARRLAESQGASLRAGPAEGGGAVFSLSLPLAEA